MVLDPKLLHELFEYRPDGKLVRRLTLSGNAKAGEVAGTIDGKGYLRVSIKKRVCLVHRIIWTMVHGSCPPMLDHINGDKLDNRIENLRPCTNEQNQQNAGRLQSNTTGVKGVDWQHARKRYRARIHVERKRVTLGYFDTLEEAATAIKEARSAYHGEFAKHE